MAEIESTYDNAHGMKDPGSVAGDVLVAAAEELALFVVQAWEYLCFLP